MRTPRAGRQQGRSTDFVAPSGRDGVVLHLHVRPNAQASRVLDVDPWRGALIVQVKAAPEHGEANAEVAALIAGALGVPASNVTLLGGATTRDKRIRIQGVTVAHAHQALGGAR